MTLESSSSVTDLQPTINTQLKQRCTTSPGPVLLLAYLAEQLLFSFTQGWPCFYFHTSLVTLHTCRHQQHDPTAFVTEPHRYRPRYPDLILISAQHGQHCELPAALRHRCLANEPSQHLARIFYTHTHGLGNIRRGASRDFSKLPCRTASLPLLLAFTPRTTPRHGKSRRSVGMDHYAITASH